MNQVKAELACDLSEMSRHDAYSRYAYFSAEDLKSALTCKDELKEEAGETRSGDPTKIVSFLGPNFKESKPE